ncbi:MAG: hypothetical protein Kow00109_30010 [Acidobacteriota bacterium]
MGEQWGLVSSIVLGMSLAAFAARELEVPPENVFDFSRVTKKEVPRTGEVFTFVMGGFAVYAKGFRYRPLEVHLQVPGGERRFRYGEPVVFEVMLENVGEHEVTLPWSVDWEGVGLSPERPAEVPPEYWNAAVSVRAAPAKPSEGDLGYRLVLEELWGSARLPGSLKRLKPGEAVKFLLPGRWEPIKAATGEPLGPLQEAVKLRLFAEFGYSYQHEDPYYIERARSAEVEVELVP